MDYIFYIMVHMYAEDKLNDSILALNSENYGIFDKEIVEPLKKINGQQYCIKNIQKDFSVEELWNWIDYKLYGDTLKFQDNNIYHLVKDSMMIEKYLVFNELRYTIEDIKKPLSYYLERMGVSECQKVNIEILLDSNAGTIYEGDGIRYYMYSREYGKHNFPHVHVDIRNEVSGSFSIIDGKQLSDGKIKAKDRKKIENKINEKRNELIKYWNEHTDGLTVDLNQAFDLIKY